MSRPFSGIYINPNITSPSKAGIGLQPPPPMMRGPMMMDRRRLVGLAIVVGLVFLLAGAVPVEESEAPPEPGATSEDPYCRGDVWRRSGSAAALTWIVLSLIWSLLAGRLFR